jgi:membrane protease YdiL (CAAX protease family)
MKFLERSLDRQNQWWKYLVCIIGIVIAWQIIGALPLGAVIFYKAFTSHGAILPNPENPLDFTALGISNNIGLILMLSAFVIALVCTIILIKLLHKRSFSETLNGTNKIRFGRLWIGFAVWGILMLIYCVVDYLIDPSNFVLQFNVSNFIPLFFISVLTIPLQTTFEEVLCRGYLAQGIAGWTKNRILPIVIPALLFALLHSFNPEVEEFGFWITMPQYFTFGLLFGIIAVLDDGIELAIGMHTANNVLMSLFVTHQHSALQTDAVFEQLTINPVKDLVVLLVMCGIAFVYLSYRYKWKFNVLGKKVEVC